MGLTSALYTGLSGMNTAQYRIDTIGDNISNVNTTAFKGNRSVFQTQFAQTYSSGSPPSTSAGGTNPMQVGLGSVLGAVQRSFTPGSIETTGVNTDLAIEGDGFFIVSTPEGEQLYTRDGTMKLSASNYLVSTDGSFLQGFGIDDNFNIIPGSLQKLTVPVGALSTARPTTEAKMVGNLNGEGDLGTEGTILVSPVAYTDGAGGSGAVGTTLLANLYDPTDNATALFAAGDVVTLSSVKRGGRDVVPDTFTVTGASTLDDFLTFLQNKCGIDTTAGQANDPGYWISDGTYPPAAGTPGELWYTDTGAVPAAGTIIIEGNIGVDNRLTITRPAIASTNANHPRPFEFAAPKKVTGDAYDANGESAFTSFVVYDSLGAEVPVNMTAVLSGKASTGNTWTFYAQSPADTDPSRIVGMGTLTFDTNGGLVSSTGTAISIDRVNTGAATPLTFDIDFSMLSQFENKEGRSELVMGQQDGFRAGTLNSFSVGENGIITGTFSNGLTRTLGQVALAKFANPEGLIALGNNNYRVGPNSGIPMVTAPQQLGAGKILSGSLELSNVDLSREFIGLITATTSFSASSRVISTSNDLLNQLLSVAR